MLLDALVQKLVNSYGNWVRTDCGYPSDGGERMNCARVLHIEDGLMIALS